MYLNWQTHEQYQHMHTISCFHDSINVYLCGGKKMSKRSLHELFGDDLSTNWGDNRLRRSCTLSVLLFYECLWFGDYTASSNSTVNHKMPPHQGHTTVCLNTMDSVVDPILYTTLRPRWHWNNVCFPCWLCLVQQTVWSVVSQLVWYVVRSCSGQCHSIDIHHGT